MDTIKIHNWNPPFLALFSLKNRKGFEPQTITKRPTSQPTRSLFFQGSETNIGSV